MTLQPPQPAAQASIPGQPIQPLFVRKLDEGDGFRSAVVSPDGQSVYAVASVPMTDVGILINTHALAFASIAAGLLAAAALAYLSRKAFRRRTVGAMHCRRCDYIVTGLVSAAGATGAPARCPECGVDLARKPPRPGQSTLRRIGLPLAFLIIVAGAYGWYAALGRKAYPWPIPTQRWGSLTLADWSTNPRLTWLKDATFEGHLLLELDAQTGVTRRVIAKRPTMACVQLAYNPAADGLYIAGNFDVVDLVSVKSGRTIASLQGHNPADAIGDYIIGHDKAGDKVYLSCAQIQGESWVAEWDWRTGAVRRLFTAQGWTDGRYRSSRLHFRIPGEPLTFLRFPDDSEVIATGKSWLSVVNDRGEVLRRNELGPRINARKVSISADGSMIFASTGGVGGDGGRGGNGGEVVAIDAATLKPIGELSVGGFGPPRHAVRSDGRLMIMAPINKIFVRDVREKAWVAALALPEAAYGPDSFGFSADGRTVCAVFTLTDAASGQRSSHLGAWRLPETLGVNPSPAAP